jgi:3-phenylpropionate/cinnamic acid dioxygenase small subunit
MNWKLVRERDGLTKQSEKVLWIEFDDSGRFRERYDEIGVGRSLLMSPFNDFFTWQTTTVTEIVEDRDDYIKFKTQNSNYELFKL